MRHRLTRRQTRRFFTALACADRGLASAWRVAPMPSGTASKAAAYR